MLDDDGGTFAVVEFVVGVEPAVLVFGEVERCFDFADVVVKSTYFGEEGVASNLVDEVFADVGYLHGMLEGSRSVAGEFAESRVVGGGKLHEGEVGGESEGALEEVDEGVGKEGEECVEEEDEVASGGDAVESAFLTEDTKGIDECVGEEYDATDEEEFATVLEVADGDDGHHAGNELGV